VRLDSLNPSFDLDNIWPEDLPEAFPENGGFSWICQASFCMFTFIVWDVFLIVYGILSSLNSASDAIFLESKQLNETMYGNPWGGHHTFRKMIYYVGKAIINHSPSHHFYRWYKPFPVMAGS